MLFSWPFSVCLRGRYILIKICLKIFLSKFSLTYANVGVYYLPLSITMFNILLSTFFLQSSEIDCKKGQPPLPPHAPPNPPDCVLHMRKVSD